MKFFAIFTALFLWTLPCFAQENITTGFDLRTRYEYYQNATDMNPAVNDDSSYFRIKGSFWTAWKSSGSYAAYLRLSNETRYYLYRYSGGTLLDRNHMPLNEIFFEDLYGDWNNIVGQPVKLRAGRQELRGEFGEDFLISDGTPEDASRSFYFNAVRMTANPSPKVKVDLLYINDPRQEQFLPRWNIQRNNVTNADLNQLNASSEQGAVAYFSLAPITGLKVEPYYMFKHEDAGAAAYQSVGSNLHTVGAYAKYTFKPFTLRGQGLYQAGSYGQTYRNAYAWYAFADAEKKDWFLSPSVSAGYVSLSGDDPNTGRFEAFNPLFSRSTTYSLLYFMAFKKETGMIGYWTNLKMARFTFAIEPIEKLKVSYTYSDLKAHQPVASLGGTGTDRGQLQELRAAYPFTKDVTSYVIGEKMHYGDFYQAGAGDGYCTRAELSVKF